MGTPELEDYIDGANWLIESHNADPERIGSTAAPTAASWPSWPCSMRPDLFAAGAALRPVRLGSLQSSLHLEHPQYPGGGPEAYERSSPIEFAEGLEGHLLMTHGMLDDNVFYQDVVRLAQRLLDLEKDNWELASYPLERHAFASPESWLDQYQRILDLFERTIGGSP
jgi:dipeptidyl aminopeptidase/acylaminoacyl peptidase